MYSWELMNQRMVQDRLLLRYSGDKPNATDIHLQGAHPPGESRPGRRTCRGIPSGAGGQWEGEALSAVRQCPISTAITLLTPLTRESFDTGKTCLV